MTRNVPWFFLAGIAVALSLAVGGAPATVLAQQDAGDQQPAARPPSVPGADDVPPTDDPLTFLDSVTVSATLRPAPVRETPGTVSVIDSQTMEERLVRDFADLVKYEPGVYVETNVTRLGLNGFNIRGIGGNRVMTQVDGVQTSEQFDFGPFNVHQVGLDVDALKTVEIVRSANSALYGSDALGGVVSLFTKDPADYLNGRGLHLGAKTTWDGRSDAVNGNLALAAGTERLQGSLFASAHRGNELRNKGTVEAADDTRTAPNPQDIRGLQLLAKLVFTPSPGNMLRTSAEAYDTRIETEWFSDRGLLDFGRFQYHTADSDAVDTQDRLRLSVDHTLVDRGLDQFSWRLYGQFNDTAQVVDRQRMTFGFGPPFPSLRHGTLDFEQVGYGTSLQGQQWIGDPERGVLFTAGSSYQNDYFDILRDRTETHGVTGDSVPTSLIFPTKYFPESTVTELGAYLQAEFQFGRLSFVPGVRYDHFALDANQNDPVFIASLNPEAADFSDGAMSPKLGVAANLTDALTVHAQYSGGFRAPPYSAINTGFTNPRGGYTTLPNPELRAETSRNVEVGVRAAFERTSLGLTVFSNRYDNFIASTSLGLNPVTGLLEFQSQNLEEAEIEGVELRGEAYLSDSLMLRWSYARINGVEIFEDTVVPPLAEETQLGEIAPNEGVLGLRYVRPSGRWGSELSVRLVEAYQHGSEEQFAPEAYQVVDLVGFVSLAESLTFRLGLLNLTDSKYFEWWNVRGRPGNDPVIDRYTSPGTSVVASLGYDW
jgi:hemoglobin/transferrin/lactoferrin receptor protein